MAPKIACAAIEDLTSKGPLDIGLTSPSVPSFAHLVGVQKRMLYDYCLSCVTH